MKNLFTFFALLPAMVAMAQVSNLNLDSWDALPNYEEPSGPWATPNKTVDIAPTLLDPFVTKTTDAQSGTYAARMESAVIFGAQFVSGALWTGDFVLDIQNPLNSNRFGVPYTDRPTKFKGYYKYINNQGDSCDIYVLLTKWVNNTRTTVGTATMPRSQTIQTVTSYTPFDIDFQYNTTETPDSISIIFASSAGGQLFQGQAGATLFIDNISLELTSGVEQVLMPELAVNTFPNPAQNNIQFQLDERVTNAQLYIYTLDGKVQHTAPLNGNTYSTSVQGWTPAKYYYLIRSQKGYSLASGAIQVQ